MENYLKHYNVCLEVRGPVFVGSGREITKKEYIFWNNNTMGVIDLRKMNQLIHSKHLDRQYESFVLNENRVDLRNWLLQQKININEVRSCMRYIIDQGDTSLVRGTKAQVMEIMKDPYGNPYIPGSTLKGMFRTILLSDRIMKGDAGVRNVINGLKDGIDSDRRSSRTNFLKREIGSIESAAFNTLNRPNTKPEDAVNSVLAGLIVSDSEPLSVSDLVLCQKVEVHTDGSEKQLNLLRECLKPGTKVKFTITIDERLLHLTAEDLLNDVSSFNNQVYDNFLSKFKGTDRLRTDNVYVGGGTGFLTKTIIYPALGQRNGVDATVKIFEKTNVPSNHKHYEDRGNGVSPHILKCTHYKGKTMQFGECGLKFE